MGLFRRRGKACQCDPQRAFVCERHQREHAQSVAALDPERMAAHFVLAEAHLCADCTTVFSTRVYRACPNCTSTSTDFIEELLRRIAGLAHEAATVTELERLHVLKSA